MEGTLGRENPPKIMLWPEGSTNQFPMRNHPWSHLLVTLLTPHFAPAEAHMKLHESEFNQSGNLPPWLFSFSTIFCFTATDNSLKVQVRIVLGLTGTNLWNGGRRCFYISSGVPVIVLFPNSVEMFQLACEAWKTRTDQQIQVWGIQNLFLIPLEKL